MRTTSWHPLTTGLAVLALAGSVGACSDGNGSEPELSAEQEAELATATEYARCLREQGIEDFPDPQVNEDGFILTGAPFEDQADDFMAAQEACQHVFGDGAEPEGPGLDPATWQEVTPGGDCQCSDGSEFNLWVREANPDKVVLFLEDGGACFSAETCDPANELYNVSITEGPDGEGIFDFAHEGNPFADHSVVYVPYCTADVFIGNAVTEYAPGLTVQHKGYVNGTAALDHLESWFPLVGLDPGDLLTRIDANEALIEAADVDLVSYIAPGDEHTALTEDRFYTEEVDGQLLVNWVTKLIAGEPVDDVRCAECTAS